MSISAFIGLGSNLEQPAEQLRSAIKDMSNIPETNVQLVSSFYLSRPMGPSDQPDYVNAVAELQTELDCHSLLHELQRIELQHGRVRKEQRWGARTLDLDILLYGDEVINEPDLIVPHYGMKSREFVLYPLAEISSELILPCGTVLKELLVQVPENGIKRLPNEIGNPG
ncbi:2-amino-4-hydroxy-6-hydroxymethyldihydropteridine diphosphokinase [Paraneptunicella aestuarii]|uniref:2-amino-4-hydroxy-6- hydroxymethyldihydropteridine diphosphokinase n=1 Tax=Paraneptunicella aestuarii TaxID=2831148 RepID=UPI001E627264|nr:2-amino-4-hydroxy-6-hydroxymethyldihydropteridine diphosphokinase [Paraneptunicella aestuarii]